MNHIFADPDPASQNLADPTDPDLNPKHWPFLNCVTKTSWPLNVFNRFYLVIWRFLSINYYFRSYGPITSAEQRTQYKKDFNTHYNTYIQFHQILDRVRSRFTELENRLKGALKGSPEYSVNIFVIVKKNHRIWNFIERARTTGVHLNIRDWPTFAVLVWTVPPIYNY